MYIARNSNGCLWIHEQKPTRKGDKNKGYWESNGHKMPIENRTPYPRWQDEPISVLLQVDWITESTKE